MVVVLFAFCLLSILNYGDVFDNLETAGSVERLHDTDS